MSGPVAWIAAEAEENFSRHGLNSFSQDSAENSVQKSAEKIESQEFAIENLPAHQFPQQVRAEQVLTGNVDSVGAGAQKLSEILREYEEIKDEEERRRRRIYRSRTISMLRRYLKFSIETGRLPSLLGQEFFRANVTTYSVVTFEDRVIFVHDMEKCLAQLDKFSRELIARHILQEHDRWATARLLHCNEKTVRRLMPIALDQLCEIMLDAGLMEKIDVIDKKSCQGGLENEISVSDCDESENKF
jgi:hypothetical protein